MADGGIGEAALISAAVGGGMSAVQGRDPLQGMIMGGLLGGAGAGLGLGAGAAGGEALAGEVVADAAGNQLLSAGTVGQAPVYEAIGNAPGMVSGTPSFVSTPLESFNISPYSDFGQANPFASAAPTTNGIVGAQGGQNVLQNQLGATVGGAPTPDLLPGAAGSSTTISPAVNSVATGAGATPAATGSGGISNLLDKAGSYLPETTAGKVALGGGLGLAALMAQERNKYGVPEAEKYTGPLSKFSYNPNTYKPDIVSTPVNPYRPQYAAGGPVEQMSNNAVMGANTMYPMANMATSSFATPYQAPQSTNMLSNMAPSGGGAVNMMSGEPSMQGTRMASGGRVPRYGNGGFLNEVFGDAAQLVGDAGAGIGQFVENAGEGRIGLNRPDRGGYQAVDYKNPYSLNQYRSSDVSQNVYNPQYASGGIASLGSYSDGGRMLKGPGDGMSDSIPARIGRKQEARLADGEFVVPADVVSHLGNGSTDAGAKQLYSMMDKVRQARTGRKSQGSQIRPNKYMPA